MPVKLISPGGGSVTLDVPSMANTYTLMLPTSNSGSILTTAVYPAAPGTSANVLTSNGTAFVSQTFSSLLNTALPNVAVSTITSGTANATTSGTTIDFTGIPSWVKRITVLFNGVSTGGTSNFLIQGGSGSFENTGYISNSVYSNTGSAASTNTTGFVINYSTFANAATSVDGMVVLAAMGSNLWVESHTMGSSNNGAALFGAGRKTFSGAIDRIRITTVSGDTFDAGSINILYE